MARSRIGQATAGRIVPTDRGAAAKHLDLFDEWPDAPAESGWPTHGDRVDRPFRLRRHHGPSLGRFGLRLRGRLPDHARAVGRPDDALHGLESALIDLIELLFDGFDAVHGGRAVDEDDQAVQSGMHDLPDDLQDPFPIGEIASSDQNGRGLSGRHHAPGQTFDVLSILTVVLGDQQQVLVGGCDGLHDGRSAEADESIVRPCLQMKRPSISRSMSHSVEVDAHGIEDALIDVVLDDLGRAQPGPLLRHRCME